MKSLIIPKSNILNVKRGRPKKIKIEDPFAIKKSHLKKSKINEKFKVNTQKLSSPLGLQIIKGLDLKFKDELFKPIKTNTELDIILSTDGGLMPGTNMILVGGPGSGKSTLALDMLSNFTSQGYKCLFISGEMDEIAFYKYCKRLPKFNQIPVLFLKNYQTNIKEVLEYVFNLGYNVISIDSLAEVIDMIRDNYKMTEGAAEHWLLNLQDKHKKGENINGLYTAFINIQQVTKEGEFRGSNRIKHMTDAMAHIGKPKINASRSIYFSKNRDCDKDFRMNFTINSDFLTYNYERDDE
jgi:predicted ATP-dependent serine protease